MKPDSRTVALACLGGLGMVLGGSYGCGSSASVGSSAGGAGGSVEVASHSASTASAASSVESSSVGLVSGSSSSGGGGPCPDPNANEPPLLDATMNKLAPEFQPLYVPYDLGPVPGLEKMLLGGCATKPGDPTKLLVVGGAEHPGAAVYEIGVDRDGCGHIRGFVGTAKKLVTVDQADATVVVTASGNLLIPLYPVAKVAQVDASTWTTVAPAWSLEPPFKAFPAGNWTPGHQSAGGLAFVPESVLQGAHLRAAGYPVGDWIHIELQKSANDPKLYDLVSADKTGIVLPNGPGGVAYVPAGSPGFPKASLLVVEWLLGTPPPLQLGDPQRIVVYEVDASGDPIVATRKEFFSEIVRPWGAYFEALTGDLIFLSWNVQPDHLIQVRGFAKPPEPPK